MPRALEGVALCIWRAHPSGDRVFPRAPFRGHSGATHFLFCEWILFPMAALLKYASHTVNPPIRSVPWGGFHCVHSVVQGTPLISEYFCHLKKEACPCEGRLAPRLPPQPCDHWPGSRVAHHPASCVQPLSLNACPRFIHAVASIVFRVCNLELEENLKPNLI